tara:strand:- start:163 stop:432 length:270 start_codon:yes stop_codon:yes gene_type:complete
MSNEQPFGEYTLTDKERADAAEARIVKLLKACAGATHLAHTLYMKACNEPNEYEPGDLVVAWCLLHSTPPVDEDLLATYNRIQMLTPKG